ncbi:MAG: hypothetical protein M3R38_24445, partial [Actinomycetota bacterium]|nr:hypothetical protein [Actinomycetota bacterium]
MSRRPTLILPEEGPPGWEAAYEALARLDSAHRQTIGLLVLLPLARFTTVERFLSPLSRWTAYKKLGQLSQWGLVATTSQATHPWGQQDLRYLTTLGVAVAALMWRRDLHEFAEKMQLRQADLKAREAQVSRYANLYHLLGALATSAPGKPHLLRWEYPYRGPGERSLPYLAGAAISWDGRLRREVLLLVDEGSLPLATYTETAEGLLKLRSRHPQLPTLVLATEREWAWERLMLRLRGRGGVLPARLYARFAELDDGEVEGFAEVETKHARGGQYWIAQPPEVEGETEPPSEGKLPRIVRRELARAPDLSSAARELLGLVGAHIWLTRAEIQAVMSWDKSRFDNAKRPLAEAGYIRELSPLEPVSSVPSLEELAEEGEPDPWDDDVPDA